ncbi:cytochrome P450 [Streptomyces sp. NPDC098781]|uniref:cytochrome P450 n=1 Tax=Streptomyces sp. NPDC098781 TaxID=3366097 RepID=UPI00382F32FB
MTDSIHLPFEQPHPLRMPPLLDELKQQGPIHRIRTRVGDEAWLITDHREVRRLLAGDRLGRSHPDPENAARVSDSALLGGPSGNFATEREDHARMRSLLKPYFSPRRTGAMRSRVKTMTTQFLDAMAGRPQPVDLNEALAAPLAVMVICELLGVPYEDRAQFGGWVRELCDVHDHALSERGLMQLYAYGQQLVTLKRENPGDDVISGLCATEGLTDDEISRYAMVLLFAGHATTVVQIGLGVLLFLTNPEQRESLLDDPDLVVSAVEETLRAPGKASGGLLRYARGDIHVGPVTIRTGDLVLLDISAANHDETVFPEPDRFDIARDTTAHLTFGHGAHYCIGAPLARLELQIVLSHLTRRFPEMRLAVPVEALTIRNDLLSGALAELPVSW